MGLCSTPYRLLGLKYSEWLGKPDHSITMGKRVSSVGRVRRSSLQQMPNLEQPRRNLTFREVKRRTIIAGLRAMKAPAVLQLQVSQVVAMNEFLLKLLETNE